MNNRRVFSVGEYITDYSGIYEISDIKTETDKHGGDETFIFYKPTWIDGISKDFTARIPLDNMYKSGLRKILTKEIADQIVSDMNLQESASVFDFFSAQDALYQNNIERIPLTLKSMWVNQSKLKKNEADLMSHMLANLSREISFVTKTEQSEVSKTITDSLNSLARTE